MGFWNKSKALGIHCEGSRVFLAVLEMESKNRVEPVLLIEGKLPEVFDAYALKDSGARNEIADLIADIIEENDINLRNVRFALNYNSVFVKRSPISLGETNKIREHLRWEAITILDAKDEMLVTDFFSVTDWTFSVAIREKVLGLYRDIAKRAGIKKIDVDVPHFGLYNAVDGAKFIDSSGAHILMYIGENEVFVVLVNNGELVQIGTYVKSNENSISQSVEDGIFSIISDIDDSVENVFCAGNFSDKWIEDLVNKLNANAIVLDPFSTTPNTISNCEQSNELHSRFAIAIGLAKRELVS